MQLEIFGGVGCNCLGGNLWVGVGGLQ
jgi:hypothetical protein